MYCRKCGKKIGETAQFCEFCGFNQKEKEESSNVTSSKTDNKQISWYQLDTKTQKKLKHEFKQIQEHDAGLEALAVICYIAGAIAALFCVGNYTVKVLNQTVASGTFISTPMLIITLFLFTAGTIAGYSSNRKFDRSFSQWLLTKNIIK